MKTRKQKTLGFTVDIANVPETMDEAAPLFGSPTDVIEAAVDEEVFRGWLPVFREKLIERFSNSKDEGGLGISREVIGQGPKRKDGSTPDIFEKDTSYLKKVRAAVSVDVLNPIAKEVAAAIKFDPSASSPTSGRIGKKYITAAEQLKAAVDQGMVDWETVKSNILSENPDFEFEYDEDGTTPTIESLAAAYKADEVRAMQAATQKFAKKQ